MGKIIKTEDNILHVEIAKDTVVRLQRSTVTSTAAKEEKTKETKGSKTKDKKDSKNKKHQK